MDAKLKERAQKVAQLRNANTKITSAQITEIGQVHYLLTGRTTACTSCNMYTLLNEISQKLIQEPLIIKDMANAKGQFKSNASSREIIRHTKTGTKLITPENINTGDNFEWAAKNFPHLVEESKAAKAAETEEEKPATKTSAKK